MTKFEKFAQAMSELLFEMRCEDLVNMILFADVDETQQIPVDFVDSILDEDIHIASIKEYMRLGVLESVQQCPSHYQQDSNGEFLYSTNVYDFAYLVDVYIKEQYEEEKQNLIILVLENCYGERDHTSRSHSYKTRLMFLKSKTNEHLRGMLEDSNVRPIEPPVNLVVDKVVEQLKQDFALQDYTRLETLLKLIPRQTLIDRF
jgi:hypothetical protein